MIVNKESGIAFVHIPKNAGSTLRDQIAGFDDYDGQFSGRKEHETLGPYDAAHLPLFLLKRHWPDVFETVAGLDVFAITRDPIGRFKSALAQRIRQHHDRLPTDLSPQEITREIDQILSYLDEGHEFPKYELVHFCRQIDFVEVDGQRIAQNLYPIKDTPRLIEDIAHRLGADLMPDIQVNKTVTFKYAGTERAMILAKDISKKILPFGLYSRLREAAMSSLTTSGADNLSDAIQSSSEVQRFLKDHYAEDFELHAQVVERRGGVEGAPER